MNEIMDCILRRRSIRNYTSQAVEKEKLTQLLEAAMAAPTACNSQPWEFVVITDEAIMLELRSALQQGHYNAPAAIVVCGNLKVANNSCAKHFWVQDCSAAVENMLIAAVGLGLGTVWCGAYPLPSVIARVVKVAGLPEEAVPLCVVYVGYAAEEKPARTQYNEQRVYWQQYEKRKRQGKVKNAKLLP
jgi:nitroreductase